MQNIELKISGMTCGSCQSHVTKALQSAPGVQSVVVDLARGTARIEGEDLDQAALVGAVEEEGYGVQPAENAGASRTNSIPLTPTGCSCCG
jgi:copper chaperone